MAAMMNICGLTPVDDPSYRYKMPMMQTKIEGRGNGIKTVLTNVVDIGLSLNRDPHEITKFFGTELGSQTSFSEETGVAKAVVNGAQTTQAMQNYLKSYIEKFVLCRSCRLPESHYKIKSGLISQSCAACGHKEAVDMTHKLTTFILKQHQTRKDEKKKEKAAADEKAEKKKEKKEKKDRKDKEKEGDSAAAASSSSSAAAAAEDGSSGAKKEKKDKKDKKDKKSKKDHDGASSNSSAMPPNPPEEEASNSRTGRNDVDDISDKVALEECITTFKAWHAEHGASATPAVIVEKIRSLQTLASLRTADRYLILMGGLFTDAAVTKNEVEKYKNLFEIMLTNRIQQRQLLAAVEWYCGCRCVALLKYFPVFFKQLFDADLVEEDIFFQWNLDSTPNDYSVSTELVPLSVLEAMKASAAPFITWLDEAEEEDDDDDEEEEEDDDEEDDDA